jgi:uncharacterized cofD-like protein
MPAPGDLRRCLVAMADAEAEPLGAALDYRFDGTDVEGHALGNLLLAALGAVTGDFVAATEEVSRLLGTDPRRHRVAPATIEPVELCAETTGGDRIRGQVAVANSESIEQVSLEPVARSATEPALPNQGPIASPAGVAQALAAADQIVLGPGDLYTSVLAAAIVDDIRAAVAESGATRVYVCNLRADNAETNGYDVARHVDALRQHGIHPDVVLVDPASDLAHGSPVPEIPGAKLVLADLARPHGLAHDSPKLAQALHALH